MDTALGLTSLKCGTTQPGFPTARTLSLVRGQLHLPPSQRTEAKQSLVPTDQLPARAELGCSVNVTVNDLISPILLATMGQTDLGLVLCTAPLHTEHLRGWPQRNP